MNKKFRLKNSREISLIKKTGHSFVSPFFILSYLPNQTDQTQLAVIASRSVGGAVQRNRCKRILRAALKPYLTDILAGFNIVLIARSRLLEADFNEISKTAKSLLCKANLLNGSVNG